MEQILGVMYGASKHKTHQDWVQSRIQTVEADALDQAEGDNEMCTRYQCMFWEPVVEGTVHDSSPPLVCVSSEFLTLSGWYHSRCLKKRRAKMLFMPRKIPSQAVEIDDHDVYL